MCLYRMERHFLPILYREIMKQILSAIFLLLAQITAVAEAPIPSLIVWKTDGSKIIYSLGEQPKTTFSSEGIVITTSTLSVTYPLSEIVKYTYEGIDESDIETIMGDEGFSMSQNGYNFLFSNLKENTVIQVFSANGILISSHINDGKQIEVSLVNQSNGIYIIKAGDVTFKVLKR